MLQKRCESPFTLQLGNKTAHTESACSPTKLQDVSRMACAEPWKRVGRSSPGQLKGSAVLFIPLVYGIKIKDLKLRSVMGTPRCPSYGASHCLSPGTFPEFCCSFTPRPGPAPTRLLQAQEELLCSHSHLPSDMM